MLIPEIIRQIILYLPIDGNLQNIPLAFGRNNKFAPWILSDVSFAALHIQQWLLRHNYTLSDASSLLQSNIWNRLPFSYKAALFRIAFVAESFELVGVTGLEFSEFVEGSLLGLVKWSDEGVVKLVMVLAADLGFDFHMKGRVMNWCCYFGYMEAVEYLLATAKVVPSVSGVDLRYAIDQGKGDVAGLLVSDVRSFYGTVLADAAGKGLIDLVDVLLDDSRVRAAETSNLAIRNAAGAGHLDIVQKLLGDSRYCVSKDHSLGLAEATRNCRWHVVDYLFPLAVVNNQEDMDAVFLLASEGGRVKLVQALWTGKYVTPELDGETAFIAAYENGHVDVVDVLLRLKVIDPVEAAFRVIDDALNNADYAMVRKLLQYPEVQAIASPRIMNWAIYDSIVFENTNMLQHILEIRDDVDPNVRDCFQTACKRGYAPSLKILFDDSRLDILTDPLLLQGVKDNIFQILVQHPRSNVPTSVIHKSLKYFCSRRLYDRARLHFLHHNLRVAKDVLSRVFGTDSNLGEYLRDQLIFASKCKDFLTVKSILSHPRWDPQHDEAVDEVLIGISQFGTNKEYDNDVIRFVLRHRRYTECKLVEEGTRQWYLLHISHALLFPTIAPDIFEGNIGILRWAVENRLEGLVLLLIEGRESGDISGDDHYILRTVARFCGVGYSWSSMFVELLNVNVRWFEENCVVPRSQEEVNWLLFRELKSMEKDRKVDVARKLFLWAVTTGLGLVVVLLTHFWDIRLPYEHGLELAAELNNCELVKFFLKIGKLDPISREYWGLRKAVENGCVACVGCFLERKEVKLLEVGSNMISVATERGYDEVVVLLQAKLDLQKGLSIHTSK